MSCPQRAFKVWNWRKRKEINQCSYTDACCFYNYECCSTIASVAALTDDCSDDDSSDDYRDHESSDEYRSDEYSDDGIGESSDRDSNSNDDIDRTRACDHFDNNIHNDETDKGYLPRKETQPRHQFLRKNAWTVVLLYGLIGLRKSVDADTSSNSCESMHNLIRDAKSHRFPSSLIEIAKIGPM